MEVGRHWVMKKNPALYLFDIAVLLALFRQIDIDNVFSSSQNVFDELLTHGGPVVGILPPTLHPHQFEDDLFNQKLSALDFGNLHNDYQTIMDDAHRRIPRVIQPVQNTTNNDTAPGRNITALILQFPENEVSNAPSELSIWNNSAQFPSNIEIERNSSALDIFDAMSPNEHNNFSELLSNSQNSEEIYNNADDVRWQEYLTEYNSTTKEEEKTCETNSTDLDCIDIGIPDDIEITSLPDARLRTTSEVSEESGIELLEASEVKSTSTSDPPQSRDQQELYHEDYCLSQNQYNNADDIFSENADLIQMMYQQDVDLGYNYQHADDYVKLSDTIDDISKENNTQEAVDFMIDGETGEHIPIAAIQLPATDNRETLFSHPAVNPADTNSTLSIEECFQLLENSIDDIQPQNQTTLDNQNNMIRNLTSLIDESETISPPQINNDLWQQIADLSELSGLNLPTESSQPQVQGDDFDLRLSTGLLPNNTTNERPLDLFVQSTYFDNTYGVAPVAMPPAIQPYDVPGHFSATDLNSSLNTSQSDSMSFTPSSEYGLPMDTGFPSASTSPDREESDYDFGRLNNLTMVETNANQSSARGNGPTLSEPGQGFFDLSLKQEAATNIPHLASFNSTATPFDNVNGTYFNPDVIQPHTSLSSSSFPSFSNSSKHHQAAGTTLDGNAVSEWSDSDSGVSSDHSPRELYSNTGHQLNSHARTVDMRTLKTINHNHTYNGTDGVRKQTNKRKPDSNQSRQSRDERKARELDLPYSLEEIVSSPVEEYNEMLLRSSLTSAQQALVKDIRRRGKNKVAAQNCRKRKMDSINDMEENVDILRTRKEQLLDETSLLNAQKEDLKMRYNALYQQVFSSFRDDLGRSYDPNHYRLERAGGMTIIVPRMSQPPQPPLDQDESNRTAIFSKVKTEKS